MQIENIIYNLRKLIKRNITEFVFQNLRVFPAVAILGPRQCGKSTLAKMLSANIPKIVYLDLQNTVDRNKLSDPYLFFDLNRDATICIDEIQLMPELFSILRSIIDNNRRNGRFILLGSASSDLINKSSETLAGRIGLVQLTPFVVSELDNLNSYNLHKFWLRGGFPDSYLSEIDSDSNLWKENFIRTYIERDIPQLGFQIPSLQLRRLLTMCAHNQGQVLNASKFGDSLNLTHPTIRRYIDLLEQTFILRTLQPFEANVKKRLVKSPKVFVRDSGILHRLLQIDSSNDLMGNPIFGSSWEGMVIENILSAFHDVNSFFYRTARGEEIDLILTKGNKIVAIECKASSTPQLTKGFWKSIEDIKPNKTFIVTPGNETYKIAKEVTVCDISEILKQKLF